MNLFWKRGTAYLVDLFCIYATTVLTITGLIFFYAIVNKVSNPKDLILIAEAQSTKNITRIIQAIYYFSYFTISHWYFGKTLGKYFLNLTVLGPGGKDLSFLRSSARTLAYILSGYPTLGIGYLIAYFRKDSRALHDLIAQTNVSVNQQETHEEKLAA